MFVGSTVFGDYPTSLPLSIVNLNPGTATVFGKAAFFKSPGTNKFYYAGSTTKINSLLYNQEIAFIHSYPGANLVTPLSSTATATPVYSRNVFLAITSPIPPIGYTRFDYLSHTA